MKIPMITRFGWEEVPTRIDAAKDHPEIVEPLLVFPDPRQLDFNLVVGRPVSRVEFTKDPTGLWNVSKIE